MKRNPDSSSSSTHPVLLPSSACCHLKQFYSNINPAISVLSWCSWCGFLLVPLQDHPAARWQDLFCWHRDSHWVEWVHGGGCAGWRKSSQRGTDAQGTLENERSCGWRGKENWVSTASGVLNLDTNPCKGGWLQKGVFVLRFGVLGRALAILSSSALVSRIKFFPLLQKSQILPQSFSSQIC